MFRYKDVQRNIYIISANLVGILIKINGLKAIRIYDRVRVRKQRAM
jgi:hypothetical protein